MRNPQSITAFAVVLFVVPSIPTPCLAQVGSDSRASVTTAPSSYRIQVDDTLDISVLGESDLNRDVVVLPDGTITYPYVGTFKAAGLTVAEINKRITAKLSKQFVNPNVTVSVSKRQDNYASVLGAVKTPGKVILKDGWRLLEVIAASGGITVERNEWATATLVRSGGSEAIPVDLGALLNRADATQNYPVSSGDILLVNALRDTQTHAQVLGQVVKPGAYPIPPDGSITTLIALAGGTTPQAALTRALIRRGATEIPVDLLPLMHPEGVKTAGASPASTIRLQPGDTLILPENIQRFAVIGAVTKPGAILYPEDRQIEVMEALALAGGQSGDADMRNVYLLRVPPGENAVNPDAVKPIKLDLTAVSLHSKDSKSSKDKNSSPMHLTMNPGDILVVSSRNPNRLVWRDLAIASQVFFNLRRY